MLAQPVLPLEASDNRDTAIVALKFVNSIAQWSRLDGKMPDPFAHPPLWRQTYSFGKFEDHAIDSFEQFASEITFKHRLSIGVDYVLETDIVGNTFFHIFWTERVTAWNKEKDAKGVIIWSHLDSTPNGGMYDGVLWVGAGLEAVDMLLRKWKPKKTITVVSWRSEESSPNNGVGCLWSQIATWALTIDQVEKIIYWKNSKWENVTFLQHLADKNGFSLAVMREKMVQILEKGAEHLLEKYDLWLELHIEQSGVIEANNRDLGIVAGGIGWARREKWNKDLSGLQEEYNTSDGYDFYHIKISWKRWHTWGTPPNPAKIKSDNAWDRWYREDALVGLSAILGRLDDSVIIREIGFGSPLGFTSIPDDVFIDIALPRGTILQGEELMKILWEKGVKGELNRSTGIPSWETFNGQPLWPIRGDVTIPFRINVNQFRLTSL